MCWWRVAVPDDGQRNCSKHVEFYSKNKFEKLVHLVGFIIRIILHLCFSVEVCQGCRETLIKTSDICMLASYFNLSIVFL